jgi:GTPase
LTSKKASQEATEETKQSRRGRGKTVRRSLVEASEAQEAALLARELRTSQTQQELAVLVVVEFTGELRKRKQLTTAARLARTAAAVVAGEEESSDLAESTLDLDASRSEFEELARSAGATIAATLVQRRQKPDPSSLVGQGKLDEIVEVVTSTNASLVLFDHDLSPSQLRNIEARLPCHVIDRSQLILDIFARHAKTSEGQLQVELAQLEYQLPRLAGRGRAMSQLGGGIGTRGPGETQLETDRRLLAARVKSVTRRLSRLKQQRDTGRSARAEIPVPSVALVGYTNAGKSTLFKALTGSDVYIADQLFATLDPTVRRLRLPGGAPVVLADTVGFIRELPHELVAAFQSTLQEAREAHLLLHVVDASDPHRDERIHQVDTVLKQIDAGEIPQLRVYNKIDRLQLDARLERGADGNASAVWISAAAGLGLEMLRQAIGERLGLSVQRLWMHLPPAAGGLRARLYAAGVVRDERALPDGAIELLVELPAAELAQWAAQPGVQLLEPQPLPGLAAGTAPNLLLEPDAVPLVATLPY